MQNYSARVHPGSAERTSQEVKVFPDIDVHFQKLPYLLSECTFQAWKSLKSYFETPVLFQLPVSKAREILLDDKVGVKGQSDMFGLPSSPEQTEPNYVNLIPGDLLIGLKSAVHLERTLGACGEVQAVSEEAAHRASVNNFDHFESGTDKANILFSKMIKTFSRSKRSPTPSTPDLHHPTELIVSFTSAERALAEESRIQNELSTLSSDQVKAMDDQTPDQDGLGVLTTNQSIALKHLTKGQKRGSRSCDETSSVHVNGESGTKETESCGSQRTVLNKLRNTQSRKVQKHTLKKLFKNKDIKYFYACQREKRSNTGQKSFGCSVKLSHPQKKTERWDLKPVISECGRILVPHGHCDSERIKALNDQDLSTIAATSLQRNQLEAIISTHETNKLAEEEEAAITGTEATIYKDDECRSEKGVTNQVSLEHNVFRELANENDPLTSKSKSSSFCSEKDFPLAKTIPENPSPAKCVTKSDALLSKLKSVLLEGKRKAMNVALEDTAATFQGAGSCFKKSKVDIPSQEFENVNEFSCVHQLNTSTREIPVCSVDPHFASALGLAPKQVLTEICKNEAGDCQQKNEPLDRKVQPDSDKSQVTQNFQPFHPRRGRIKALKKHQSMSTELVKKNWWLHFQNLTSVNSSEPSCTGFGEENNDAKTVPEKTSGATSSSDGLNLLADLALSSTSFEQILSQQEQAVEGRQETSFTKEPESVLHALLRQPPARQIQPPEHPFLNPVVGGADLTCLIAKEHAYNISQSTSVPMSLLVAPFQVSPLSGSTRLLHNQQAMNCEEIKPLHAAAEQSNAKEFSQKDPELQKKHKVRRERFGRSRTLVNNDGCVQVTKHWKENYNFNFDSKFTNDSKYRAICRALHGPWDFSIQDTSEEVRLIFHMWIGLFYSRSTPRTFHLDSNCLSPNGKECDPLNMLSSVGQAPTGSFDSHLNVPGTSDTLENNALDLGKNYVFASDLVGDVLDLSQRNGLAEVDIEPHAKQIQTSTFDGQYEAGHGTQAAFDPTTTVPQKNLEDNDTSGHSLKKGSSKNFSSLELHDQFDDQQEHKCGIDHIELTNHGDELAQEVSEKSRIDPFENVELLKVKQGEIQEGNEVLPQQRTTPEELRDMKATGNMEMTIKYDNMKSSLMSRARASAHIVTKQLNKKPKPVQEGCGLPPVRREFQDLVNRNKEEKSVFQVKKKSSKKAGVEESEEELIEVEDKPAQMYFVDPSSAKICAVKCKNAVNLEMEEKNAEDTEVRSPQNNDVLKFSSTKIGDLDVSQEIQIGDFTSVKSDVSSRNLSVLLSSGKKSMGVSQTEDQNADDCEAQKVADLFARKDGFHFEDADFTIHNLKVASNPNQLVAMTRDLATVKNSYFTNTRSQTLLDQKTTTKDQVNLVLDSEFDDTDCHDAMVPPICTTECRVQAPLLELSSQVTQDKNTLRNLQFKLLRAKGTLLMDQKAIQEKTPKALNEMNSVKEKCATIENSKKEEMVPSPDKQNDKGTNKQEMLSSKNCSSPKHDKTVFEAEIGSSRSDCELKQAEEELEITNISPVNQSAGSRTPSKTSVQSDELESEGKMGNPRCLKDAPVCGTTHLKTQLPLNTVGQPLNYSEISGLQSTLEPIDRAEVEVLGREGDNQCPTPTMDEEPFGAGSNIASCNNSSSVTHLIGHDNDGKKVCAVKSSALIENSIPVRQRENSGGKDQDAFHHTDMELKTQGVVRSTDKKTLVPTDESLQLFQGNADNKIDGTQQLPDQNTASLEMYLNSQRPVMAVKPSKGDTQGPHVSQQSLGESYLKSNYPEGKLPTPDLILLNKNIKEDTSMDEDMQGSSDDSVPCSWLSNAGVSSFATDTKLHQPLDTFHLHEKNGTSKSTKSPSSQSTKCVEDTEQKSQTTTECMETGKKSCLFASSSSVGDSTQCRTECDFVLEPQNSLACTIFNINNNRPESLLEKLSKRCIQADPTQASLEQECLIFSEQMKQLMKRAKNGPIHQVDAKETKNMSCPSPVIVRFSDLEEVETEVGLSADPSFVLPKIKVDTSDRKTLADTTRSETNQCPQEDRNEPVTHSSVSEVTEDCARLYTSMMNDVCGFSKVTSRSNDLRVDKVMSRSRPNNHFDFCDQMKKEVDSNFCNSMNSVVRRFCKTKYKFFILATSNNVFFEKTKVRLEFEGHQAVQPSEFFLDDDSSTLIIILRNEDIGGHICEVPNLLTLKKLRHALFVGIDEPDDVVNLTYQELFVKGGFVVFDRATLETLSLCDMKKMSELFKELSRAGKWKWMLHYRDSRCLKENARFSAEAAERKHFISWCHDVGILEVLPYHECDPLSRDQPDYLSCMIRLQVQNISSRYSVFVTDKAEDSSFGKSGILTLTLESFLTCCPSKLFVV